MRLFEVLYSFPDFSSPKSLELVFVDMSGNEPQRIQLSNTEEISFVSIELLAEVFRLPVARCESALSVSFETIEDSDDIYPEFREQHLANTLREAMSLAPISYWPEEVWLQFLSDTALHPFFEQLRGIDQHAGDAVTITEWTSEDAKLFFEKAEKFLITLNALPESLLNAIIDSYLLTLDPEAPATSRRQEFLAVLRAIVLQEG